MKLTRISSFTFCCVLFSCAFLQSVTAQETASLEGWVVDHTGAMIPAAKVTATYFETKLLPKKEKSNQERFSVVPNASGVFKFRNLPTGMYYVRAFIPGSKMTPFGIVQVFPDATSKIELIFGPSGQVCLRSDVGHRTPPTEADKAEIVRQMLKIKLKRNKDLQNAVAREEKLILSTREIKQSWLRGEVASQFELVSEKDIRKRADLGRDIKYLRFSEINAKGNCLIVKLDHVWAKGKNSKFIYLDSNGITYEFRKFNGKWTYIFVSKWVS